jgi:1-acyl-sn-glycerol-3-phosphate acyltransferase
MGERTYLRLRASLRRAPPSGRAGRRARSGWKLRRRAAAWLLVLVARTITTKSVRFLSRIDDARQRIYFANHTSHLDFILIWSSLPRHVRERTRPVAGRDYWQRSRFRRYYVGRVFDAVLVDRALLDTDNVCSGADRRGRGALEQMLEGLGDEHSLIFFPEGTRGSGESISQFRSGLYYLCRKRPDVELVPVRIRGAHKVLPKGRIMPKPQESDLTFGQPMRLEEGETKTAFNERARAALRRL